MDRLIIFLKIFSGFIIRKILVLQTFLSPRDKIRQSMDCTLGK